MKGTGQPTTGSRFKGVTARVPKVFLSRCDLSTEPDDIIAHLKEGGLNSVSSAELATSTRPQIRPPRSKSFIITLDKIEDYRNLLSGAYTPVGSEVKKYYQPRESSDVVGSFSKQYQELEILGSLNLRTVSEPATVPVYAETNNTQSVNIVTSAPLTASSQEKTATAGTADTDSQGQGNTTRNLTEIK